MPKKSRYFIFIVVAGAHAVLVGVLLNRSRAISLSYSTGLSMTAFLLRRVARPRAPVARPRLGETPARLAPIAEPVTPTPPRLPARSPRGRAIDWNAVAAEAAASVLARRKHRSFGFPAGGKSALTLGVPSRSSPHHAGESYRTQMGEEIEWTSDRCYVVSDRPSPWEPDFLRHARITRSVCLPPAGRAPGELFRSLPAYAKHHPP